MGRQPRRRTRAHGAAAHATDSLRPHTLPTTGDPLGAAAVAAAFGDADPLDDHSQWNDEEGDDDESAADAQSLSRGQRKRLKRRTAFLRKMGLASRVALEQQRQTETERHGVFADLDGLQMSLMQAEEDMKKKKKKKMEGKGQSDRKTKKPKKLSGRQRQKLAVRELGQLKAVQTHAGFQQDPFAAIQVHLQNTVVQANQELLQKSKAKQKRGASSMDVDVA
ncbi:unnamed protein product [Hyaloperonospora brassicae]|uniref:Ribosome biogenesis protein SLX9 n=1 Tax=Hyaloperonospora brassicae TaxID=162125 RepID=A0AAV0U3T9_HYABA|nr:unnamed protein product [Hyaloperonospora brassicae]